MTLLLFVPSMVPAMDYGDAGPYNVIIETFENPMWRLSGGGIPVTVFLPEERSALIPVMFFSHGLGATSWTSYQSLLKHITSRGVAVVFSPYPTSLAWRDQYEILWNGFQTAAGIYVDKFDLTRVGFSGHSWGGAATPNMTLRAVAAGWGGQGILMFIMAPWTAYGVSEADLQSLSDINLIMQVYENDTICPHSFAQATFDAAGTIHKAYYYVYDTNHTTPTERVINDFDRLAIWQPLDALMDYTFKLDTPHDGMLYALCGEGNHYKTDIIGLINKQPCQQTMATPWIPLLLLRD